MSTVLKFRRGDTTASNAFTGAEGELFVDTTKDTLVVHDGVTAGGKALATESYLSTQLGAYTKTVDLATVATSGSYDDLSNKPTIPSLTGYATESYVTTQISNLIDAAPTALNTLNELAAALNDDASFATTVTTSLSGKQATLVSGTNIKTVGGTSLLGTGNITLFSGAYADLTGKPTLFSGAYADLTGKPTLSTVATSGSYNDLTSKPTLFSGAYADLTGAPTFKTINGNSIIGSGDITISGGGSSFSGSYNDLTDKPTSFNGLGLYNANLTGPILLNGIVTDYFGQSQGTGSGDSILTSEGGYAVRWKNLKTINGNSIVGSGNITISGGSGGSSLTYGQFVDNTVALTTTAANQVIDTFSAVDYRSSKYIIQAVCDGVGIHSTEVLIIHNGATVYITEYATIFTDTSLFTVDASIVGDPAEVQVTVTPTNANTTFDVVRTSLAARTFTPPSLEGDLMTLSGTEDLQTETGSVDLNV